MGQLNVRWSELGLEIRHQITASVPRPPSHDSFGGSENGRRHLVHASGSTLGCRNENGPGQEQLGPDGGSTFRDHQRE